MGSEISTIRQTAFQGLIGAARFDITPPSGIYCRMWGAAEHDTPDGVHRPLTGTVLVTSSMQGADPLVLVTLDLGWWRSAEEEWHVRQHVLDALSIESHQLIISLTHTHAGPSLSLSHAARPGGDLIAPYLEQLRTEIVAAVKDARASAVAGSLAWATGRCHLATNRHHPGNGRERAVVGFNPSTRADDTLLVGRATAYTGEVLATLVNYACHPTTLGPRNRLLSPDFVGAMREVVEANTGGAPCLYLQGAAGELAPRRQYTDDTSIADHNGRVLGYAALSTLESMLPHNTDYRFSGIVESGASLGIWTHVAANPNQCLTSKQIEIELTAKAESGESRLTGVAGELDGQVRTERFERAHSLRQLIRRSSTLTLPTWIWRLGDSCIVGVPAECYSELQLKLRARHPEMPIAVVTIANGYFGYMPSVPHYETDNYEVQVSLFAPGCLEKLTDVVDRNISATASPAVNGLPAPHHAAHSESRPATQSSSAN